MKLKIALVGPKAAGKSSVANHLAGTDSTLEEPTVGVRSVDLARSVLSNGTVIK